MREDAFDIGSCDSSTPDDIWSYELYGKSKVNIRFEASTATGVSSFTFRNARELPDRKSVV